MLLGSYLDLVGLQREYFFNSFRCKQALVIVLILSLTIGAASASNITVCPGGGCDFTSIQAAVDSSTNGDTINVYAGTYNENIDINKSINLVRAGADVTIINALNSSDHVVEITANWVNVSGFTVTGANQSS